MFKNTFQSGFLSIFYSLGSKPLQIWDKESRSGHIRRVADEYLQSSVVEIVGTNVSSNYISCPADPRLTLGLKLPILSITRVKPYICTMSMRLDEGWNHIQLNLSDCTRRAYGTYYVETLRVQVHANCRARRIYFADRLYTEEELPPEFKFFLPIQVSGENC
uniref:CFA20 domain-containing protein n=1 Tax=Physcomitrium patens TaxID=3218 RepID=A0A7I4D069_PHYPA